jgi:signal transduction histidine kinase
MMLRLTRLADSLVIALLLAGSCSLPAQIPLSNPDATNRGIAIQSVTVQGKRAALGSGEGLKLGASSENTVIHFGSIANGANPIRLRYRLEGYEQNWHEGDCEMFLAVRFFDERGDQITQVLFKVTGESAGWHGSLTNSSLTHRREALTVPSRASRVMTLISSAGPPSTEGVYVVANLTLSKLEPDKSSPVILIQTLFDHRTDNDDRVQPPGTWMRDGNHSSMARIIKVGNDPAVRAFAILDDDPISHAEWRTTFSGAPKVAPGDNLVLEWNEMFSMGVSDLHQANYGKLPAGSYSFRVEEVNIFGMPTGLGASMNVLVRPAVWRRAWFWSAASIAIAMAIFGTGRYVTWNKMRREMAQLRVQQELERERLRIARDIHDDLGVKITRIALLTAVAEGNSSYSEKARSDFGRVSEMSRELVSALYETVWAVNPENDNLDALGNYLCQMINRLCEQSEFRTRFYVADLPKDIQISSPARNNISMAVKEAVHNVIKHAGASELVVRIEFANNVLKILLKDDGRGFEQSSQGGGNGLTNMKQRMESIGGQCLIEGEPGKGTSVHLQFTIHSPS